MRHSSEGRPRIPIRVLVADDSAFMRTAITRKVASDPELCVIGTAHDGLDAIEKVRALDPDVITLDIEMPRMDGLSVLRRLMSEHPVPIIMVSSLTPDGAQATLDALDLGGFDCIAKDQSYATLSIVEIRDELVAKIKAAAHVQIYCQAVPQVRETAAVTPSARMKPVAPSMGCRAPARNPVSCAARHDST